MTRSATGWSGALANEYRRPGSSRSFAFDLHRRPADPTGRRCRVDLELLLVSVYALVDDWWREKHPPRSPKPGRPPSLSESEVLALATVSQWPRFRSERDFWRFADAHLRPYFPNLLSHGQLNWRIRALEPKYAPSNAL